MYMYKVDLQKNSEKCRMELEVWMMMYPISKIYTHSNASRALSRISKHPNLLVKKYLPTYAIFPYWILTIIYLVILIQFNLTKTILKKRLPSSFLTQAPLCLRNILHFTEVSFVNVFKIHLTHKYSTISGEKNQITWV